MLISIKHNFETAHRLPFLEGKCQSIHGHSWQCEVWFDLPMDQNGLTVEYGQLKKTVRGWIDTYLDHGTMLGVDDKLLQAFRDDGCKLFVFGAGGYSSRDGDYGRFPWPTVEAVARMLRWALSSETGLQVYKVYVQETAVNGACSRRDEA